MAQELLSHPGVTQEQMDAILRKIYKPLKSASLSSITDPVSSFVDDTVDSVNKTIDDPFGYTKENVESGLETLNNIGSDINTYGRQFVKDAGTLTLDEIKGISDLGVLFDNPAEYFKGVTQPVFGNGYEPGFWDRYGSWLAVAPITRPFYYIGEGLDALNDYHYTGDEEALRDRAQRAGATALAGQAGDTVRGTLGSGYGANVAGGATQGATRSWLAGDEGRDIRENALLGATSALVGTAIGGSPTYDSNGNVIGFDQVQENSLNLGPEGYTFGNMAVGTTGTVIRNKRAENEYEQRLGEIFNQYNQQRYNASNIGTNAPEIGAQLQGTVADIFLSPEEKEAAKKKTTIGSGQYASANPQVSGPTDGTYLGQGGTYQL